jgi:hypothetical protein
MMNNTHGYFLPGNEGVAVVTSHLHAARRQLMGASSKGGE